MRIAMLAPRDTVQGPLPKHTPLLADGLRRLGCEVEMLPWGRRVEGERLPAKILGRARDVLGARRAVVRGDFPVVVVKTAHDWLTLPRDLALAHTLPRNRVLVLQFHGSQSSRLVARGSWLFKWATKALLGRADGVFVLSREEQGEWLRFSPDSRVCVVRNVRPSPSSSPPPSVEESPVGDARPVILCVARLIPSKGVLELVRALPLVQRERAARLVLAGDGPAAAGLRELAVELGVSDSVTVPGYLDGEDLSKLYRDAQVFALPTFHAEGFPTVILEAMAAGLPIVTTPSRGALDHLVEGRNALFVPARDAHALASALVRLLADDELRRAMGSTNREKVLDFDAAPVARDYLSALNTIVSAAGLRRARRQARPAK
jgi:glycosyltransferase involved in cell wall biosynthesis